MLNRRLSLKVLITFLYLFESINKSSEEQAGVGATLYDTKVDHVDIVNKDNYMSLYNQERATLLEFYSHWCGACGFII